jgi:hypothetical protein
MTTPTEQKGLFERIRPFMTEYINLDIDKVLKEICTEFEQRLAEAEKEREALELVNTGLVNGIAHERQCYHSAQDRIAALEQQLASAHQEARDQTNTAQRAMDRCTDLEHYEEMVICACGELETFDAYRAKINKMADALDELERVRAEKFQLPEINKELIEILGRPNFQCIRLANALRAKGRTINTRAEDEQANVIHWMLNHYLKHGDDWISHAEAELKAAPQQEHKSHE